MIVNESIDLYNCVYIIVSTGYHGQTEVTSSHYTIPGINNENPAEFFRILRIAFVKSNGGGGGAKEVAGTSAVFCDSRPGLQLESLTNSYVPFTYETFTPESLMSGTLGSRAVLEQSGYMRETLAHVNSFMQQQFTGKQKIRL